MSLRDLLHGMADAPNLPVLGITSDSRNVGDGFLFLALEGIESHGLEYLQQARDAGAVAAAWDPDTAHLPENPGLPVIAIEGLAQRVGDISNRFYDNPSSILKTVGVTGTNGKTSVAWLIAQCLHRIGRSCGYAGTLGYGVNELEASEGMTTPAAIELHAHLAEFVDQGATHAAVEVSSHGLSQDRVQGMEFEAVLFTNLTRDHLDYHGDMQSYFDAKASLFLEYPATYRIVNLDSEYGLELAARCGQDVITVSTQFDRVANGRPYLFARSVVATANGSNISFISTWGDATISLPLPGDFNVANALIVLAYLLATGVEFQLACDVLQEVTAPPGRMQVVPSDGASVFVDYAHTPDAIEAALRALRPHCRGRLWCVFGCGGDRDVGKRAQMGRLAESLADKAVVTTDNPRGEQPAEIIEGILSGFQSPTKAIVIEDRAAAIAWTIENAGPSDAILIAGKGHENYQEVRGKRLPFSDFLLAEAALKIDEVEND